MTKTATKIFFMNETSLKKLKGIRGVRPDNRKVLRATGSRTKYVERLFYCLTT